MKNLELPWPETHSVYQDAGPSEPIEFAVLGVRFSVAPTELRGCDTGRTRYFTKCLTCDEVLHEATTGPRPNIENHMAQAHGWDQRTGMKEDEPFVIALSGSVPDGLFEALQRIHSRICKLEQEALVAKAQAQDVMPHPPVGGSSWLQTIENELRRAARFLDDQDERQVAEAALRAFHTAYDVAVALRLDRKLRSNQRRPTGEDD